MMREPKEIEPSLVGPRLASWLPTGPRPVWVRKTAGRAPIRL